VYGIPRRSNNLIEATDTLICKAKERLGGFIKFRGDLLFFALSEGGLLLGDKGLPV